MVAIETGGRWSDEAAELLWQLALAKAREAPALLAHALAWERRWTRMLGTACAVAFAESLAAPNESDTWCQTGGVTPSLAELLTHDPRWWVGWVRPSLATTAFGQQLFLVWPRPGLATT